MDSRLFPEPDSEYGYSERQIRALLGDRIADFHQYMLMKAFAIATDGSAVYYVGDVHRFVEHHVPPRARRLTERDVYELMHYRLSADEGDPTHG